MSSQGVDAGGALIDRGLLVRVAMKEDVLDEGPAANLNSAESAECCVERAAACARYIYIYMYLLVTTGYVAPFRIKLLGEKLEKWASKPHYFSLWLGGHQSKPNISNMHMHEQLVVPGVSAH